MFRTLPYRMHDHTEKIKAFILEFSQKGNSLLQNAAKHAVKSNQEVPFFCELLEQQVASKGSLIPEQLVQFYYTNLLFIPVKKLVTSNELKENTMTNYKLTCPRQYGDMPKGFTFVVASSSIPKPNAQDIEKEIIKLGFNKQAQSYKSSGNFEIEKL